MGMGWALPQPRSSTPQAPDLTTVVAPPPASSPEVVADPVGEGLSSPDGSLFTTVSSAPGINGLASPVVGWAPDPAHSGAAWEVAADGGVFNRGGAGFFGSAGTVHLAEPVVGMAATPDGRGYWLVSADGGVFAFGDARYRGSAGGLHLAQPIVGMAATPDGAGYWLVSADGGVFTFGDARYHGSASRLHLARPIVSITPTESGDGYWLLSADGGVFSFGRAGFFGSASSSGGSAPSVSLVPDRSGYRVVEADGTVWTFGPGARPVRTSLAMPVAERTASRQGQSAKVALTVALSQIGKPYVEGAVGPTAFDCSGLTLYAYRAAGVALPRTAAQQLAATPHIAASQLRPGDLLFFYPGITHVGIYMGNGLMVDAPHTGAVVRVESYRWFGPLAGVARPD